MKRLLYAVALFCAAFFAPVVWAQQLFVTGTLSSYTGARVSAVSLTTPAHVTDATIGAAGAFSLRLWPSESYMLFVGKAGSSASFFASYYAPNAQTDDVTAILAAAVPAAGNGTGSVNSINGVTPNGSGNVALTLDQIPAGFSISSFTGGSTVEVGATVTNPAFAATYSATPGSASITNSDSVSSPTALSSPFTSGTVTGSFSKTSAATTVFTLSAVSTGGVTKTSTQSIVWNFRSFGGVGTPGATGATASGTTAVLAGATGTLAGPTLGNATSYGSYAPSGQKIYILMSGGSHTFTSGGFAFPMNAPTAVSFVNANGSTISMFLYESANTLTGTFTINVAS